RHHKPILFSLLLVSILLSLLTKGYESKLSTFLAIIQYFPFFIIAYLVDQQTIAKLRSQFLVVIAVTSLLSIFILYYQSNINYIIITKLEGSLFFAKLIIYIISLLISFILSAGII
ncbi:acetyltransferase, partial [Proteus mirabilis]